MDGGLDKSSALADALKDLEAQKEQLLARLSSTRLPEVDALLDIVPRAIESYRAEVGRLEQLGDSPKPEHVVRARAALRTLLGEIWLQPNGDHLVAHVELQNQALALVSGNVANGGSGGRIGLRHFVAQLCRPAMPASTRTCAAARLCRFKPSPFPNEKGPHKGALYSFGSGGVICTVPTLPTRIRLR